MDINGIKSVSPQRGVERVTRSESSTQPATQPPETQPSSVAVQKVQSVEEAISSIQQFDQRIQRNLNFNLDDSSGRVVVKVTDGVSGETIRQIPSEEVLRLAESLEEVRSLLFEAKA